MIRREVVIPKVWRSEAKSVTVFCVLSAVSILLSHQFPGSIITDPRGVVTVAGFTLKLSLPMYWFMPLLALGNAMIRIYNVRYSVDGRGIEARIGVLSLSQTVVKLRYEDIRSMEKDQSLVERMLDVGSVQIGTAGTSDVEMVLRGVAAPNEVMEMLHRERDARQKIVEKGFESEEKRSVGH